MAPDHNQPDDDAALAAYAAALADGIEAAVPGWIERCVVERAEAWRPGLGQQLRPSAQDAGRAAAADVVPRVRSLLATDVDAQAGNPLALLRSAVGHATAVLEAAGVPGVVRDEFTERAFPADVYDLSPASFADVHPDLHGLGLVWGAAKAHVVLVRRRARDD
jgi:hypothetical protein